MRQPGCWSEEVQGGKGNDAEGSGWRLPVRATELSRATFDVTHTDDLNPSLRAGDEGDSETLTPE